MEFQRIQNVAKVKESIKAIRQSENLTIKTLTRIVPEIISGVYAGDNVAIVNQLCCALKSNRRKDITYFVQAMLPHQYSAEKKTFGKRINNKKLAEKKEQDYIAFLESGMTVFEWIETKIEHPNDEIDYRGRVRKALKQAFDKGGMTPNDVLAIMMELCENDDDAKPVALALIAQDDDVVAVQDKAA